MLDHSAQGGAWMPRTRPPLVIDARPRGPSGPLAGERVLGRPVLEHLVELALPLAEGPIAIHARFDEHRSLEALLSAESATQVMLTTGPPPEGTAVLRTDRLYDPARLRRALRRGRDPEAAALWRLDAPLGLAGADDEITRRRTYQPLGRFWALAPARWLARALCPTFVRPNALTLASGGLILGASITVAFGGAGLAARISTAAALALALVLDTADGHLARLQGTSSEFGRWLDATLDELCDMALHAAVAWSAYMRDGLVGWLLVGMLYGMGKYVFVVASADLNASPPGGRPQLPAHARPAMKGALEATVRLVGHADVRWHLWIVLAACGRLDAALAAYAFYYPARALAGAARKAGRHA
jgi:phosphatidylglycerophosphate synthase